MIDQGQMWDDLEATIADDRRGLTRLKSLPSEARIALLLASSIATVLSVYYVARRADWSEYPSLRLLLEAGALAVLGSVTAVAVLRPLQRPPIALHWRFTLAALIIVAGFVLSVLPAAHANHPAALEGLGDEFARRAFGCFAFGSVVALPAVVVAIVLGRGRHIALLTFLGGGLLGALALLVHCPVVHVSHRLAGHATVFVGLLASGVTYLLLRRWLR